jgi:uncharacterized protein YbjT (DUF2867 family)
MSDTSKPVLVTGATGYVGGRLVRVLLDRGFTVRVMGRSMKKLRHRPWISEPGVQAVEADVMDRASLSRALDGCWAAYYLVHSMNPGQRHFAAADRNAARNMARAAERARLSRIIYLGGLGTDDPDLSEHLRSRAEVAEILRTAGVPVTFLRAAVIIGSGSASFEILRYLVDRLPVMITPRWVRTPCQPIGIRNVLEYLAGCLEHEETTGETYDIGGTDVITYQRLMSLYAEESGLPPRLIVPVPFLTPRLSSAWVHLITPVPASLAGPLIQGLKSPVVCGENRIQSIIPQDLLSCREAIHEALSRTQKSAVETCWTDAGALSIPEWAQCGDAPYAGGTVLECGYRSVIRGRPDTVWQPITRIGGKTGWYFGSFLWVVRGGLDRLLGGAGLRRGRRHPETLRCGDALDFWRVAEVDSPFHLSLLAEMKLPGEAMLDFHIRPLDSERTEIQMLSRFLPKGLFGLVYWYALYPFHQWIFKGMLKRMTRIMGCDVEAGPERFAPGRPFVCEFRGGKSPSS